VSSSNTCARDFYTCVPAWKASQLTLVWTQLVSGQGGSMGNGEFGLSRTETAS